MLYDSEQLGGRTRSQTAMSIFGDVAFTCGLSEILAKSINFTWYNKRVGGNEILAKLDRFFASNSWRALCPDFSVNALDFYSSDHRPIVLKIFCSANMALDEGQRRFYFESKWLMDNVFVSDFLRNWDDTRHIKFLPKRLSQCQIFFK